MVKKGKRILNLIVQDRDGLDWKVWVVNFRVDSGVDDPRQALREAVKDFVTSETQEAKASLEYAGGGFNWGDAMSSIPDEVFRRHGLQRLTGIQGVDMDVNHDEILC